MLKHNYGEIKRIFYVKLDSDIQLIVRNIVTDQIYGLEPNDIIASYRTTPGSQVGKSAFRCSRVRIPAESNQRLTPWVLVTT